MKTKQQLRFEELKTAGINEQVACAILVLAETIADVAGQTHDHDVKIVNKNPVPLDVGTGAYTEPVKVRVRDTPTY